MEVSQIISEIDSQISKLQQARALLSGTGAAAVVSPASPDKAAWSRASQGKQEQRQEGSGCGQGCSRGKECDKAQAERRRPQAHCRSDEEALGRAPEGCVELHRAGRHLKSGAASPKHRGGADAKDTGKTSPYLPSPNKNLAWPRTGRAGLLTLLRASAMGVAAFCLFVAKYARIEICLSERLCSAGDWRCHF